MLRSRFSRSEEDQKLLALLGSMNIFCRVLSLTVLAAYGKSALGLQLSPHQPSPRPYRWQRTSAVQCSADRTVAVQLLPG